MQENITQLLKRLNVATDENQKAVFAEAVAELESSELALLLESLPLNERLARWPQVPEADQIEVLVAMRSDPRETIFASLPEPQWHALLSGLHAEDLIELADSLPEHLLDSALQNMDAHQRQYYELSTQYDDDQIGRYLDHKLLIFPTAATVKIALRKIKRTLPEYTDSVYLVERGGAFVGTVPLQRIYAADPESMLAALCVKDPITVLADSSLHDATEKMEHSGLMALPVIGAQQLLVGRLTLRLALEITREAYENQLMATAGMDEDEDLFAPVMLSSQRRATWLGINLLTAFLASWAIGFYEEALQQVVALAVLMPIVASMGGIAGSQTLTLIIRGIALGQISRGNAFPLLLKEVQVGALNGLLWAMVIGLIVGIWFGSASIGLVIALAIIVNIIAAAFVGVVIPIILNKLDIDPALSGSVILTTVTDVLGFVVFLGLGTAVLLP